MKMLIKDYIKSLRSVEVNGKNLRHLTTEGLVKLLLQDEDSILVNVQNGSWYNSQTSTRDMEVEKLKQLGFRAESLGNTNSIKIEC